MYVHDPRPMSIQAQNSWHISSTGVVELENSIANDSFYTNVLFGPYRPSLFLEPVDSSWVSASGRYATWLMG